MPNFCFGFSYRSGREAKNDKKTLKKQKTSPKKQRHIDHLLEQERVLIVLVPW